MINLREFLKKTPLAIFYLMHTFRTSFISVIP
jgi:hypothetical protein